MRTERFRRLDPRRVPSPCFVVDEWALEQNLRVLDDVQRASGAKILLALKAFSMWRLAPLVASYLAGTCASGLHEARLGREEFGGEVHTFSAAYTERDLRGDPGDLRPRGVQLLRAVGAVPAARAGGARAAAAAPLRPAREPGALRGRGPALRPVRAVLAARHSAVAVPRRPRRASAACTSTRCASRTSRRSRGPSPRSRRSSASSCRAGVGQLRRRPPHHALRLPGRRPRRACSATSARGTASSSTSSRARRSPSTPACSSPRCSTCRGTACRSRSSTPPPPATCPT